MLTIKYIRTLLDSIRDDISRLHTVKAKDRDTKQIKQLKAEYDRLCVCRNYLELEPTEEKIKADIARLEAEIEKDEARFEAWFGSIEGDRWLGKNRKHKKPKEAGLTFDEATIDIRRPCFMPGQFYVAVSRVRTPGGLRIRM